MSLFLSMLGSTALLGATAITPVVSVIPNQQNTVGNYIYDSMGGTHAINKKLEAQVSAGEGTGTNNNAAFASFKIPWIELLIDTSDWFNIVWEESWIGLSSTLFYQNNIFPNSGTTIQKREIYKGSDLEMMFVQPKKIYDDGGHETNANRSANHSWEYTFSDDGNNLILDTKVSVSASNNYAWSYASITFTSINYRFYFRK